MCHWQPRPAAITVTALPEAGQMNIPIHATSIFHNLKVFEVKAYNYFRRRTAARKGEKHKLSSRIFRKCLLRQIDE